MTLSLCIWLGEKSPPGTNTSTSVIRWMQSREVSQAFAGSMFYVSVASRLSVAFGPITSPESNWLGTQLTHGRWLARLYQSKSFDSSAGRAGRGTEPYLRFFLVRNEEVVGSNPISGLERLPVTQEAAGSSPVPPASSLPSPRRATDSDLDCP